MRSSQCSVYFIFHEIVENKVYPIITGDIEGASSSAVGDVFLDVYNPKNNLVRVFLLCFQASSLFRIILKIHNTKRQFLTLALEVQIR
jgi:hypothetical protein